MVENYVDTSKLLVESLQSSQIKFDNNKLVGSQNSSQFLPVKVHAFSKSLFNKYGFSAATSGEEFNKVLDKAIAELK